MLNKSKSLKINLVKCHIVYQPPSKIVFAYLTHKVYPQVLGAVSLAVNNINNDSSILPHTKLEFKFEALSNYFEPTFSDQLETLEIMSEKRDQGVSAFIGPDESCRHEALLASAWNIPMIAFVRYYKIIDGSNIFCIFPPVHCLFCP